MLHLDDEAWREMDGIEHAEKSAAGIGARDHSFCGDFLAAGEDHADGRAIFHENLLYVRAGADFRSGLFRGGCERSGERAHSADWTRRTARGGRIHRGAKEQESRGAGGPWPHRSAKNSARCDDAAQEVRFEKFGCEIRDSHRAPANQAHHVAFAETANLASYFEELPEIFARRLFDDRRREAEQVIHNFGRLCQRFLKLAILRGVVLRKCLDRARGIGFTFVKKNGAAVGRGSEKLQIGINHSQAMARQLHVAYDFGHQRAPGMRKRGAAKPGMKFLSDGRTADDVAAFENQRLQSFFREVERGDEGVVPTAENYDIARSRHGYCFPLSFRISSAARRPGAPMMPPPGCVAEPHI